MDSTAERSRAGVAGRLPSGRAPLTGEGGRHQALRCCRRSFMPTPSPTHRARPSEGAPTATARVVIGAKVPSRLLRLSRGSSRRERTKLRPVAVPPPRPQSDRSPTKSPACSSRPLSPARARSSSTRGTPFVISPSAMRVRACFQSLANAAIDSISPSRAGPLTPERDSHSLSRLRALGCRRREAVLPRPKARHSRLLNRTCAWPQDQIAYDRWVSRLTA